MYDPATKSNDLFFPRAKSCIALYPIQTRMDHGNFTALTLSVESQNSIWESVPTSQTIIDKINRLAGKNTIQAEAFKSAPQHDDSNQYVFWFQEGGAGWQEGGVGYEKGGDAPHKGCGKFAPADRKARGSNRGTIRDSFQQKSRDHESRNPRSYIRG